MNVVGFMGNDGSLGRTIVTYSNEDLKRAVYELTDENGDNDIFYDVLSSLEENCQARTDFGTYFHGELEELETSNR